jgi:enamine deaminase RidA (YjgF/YER057c/UK114 family)
MTLMLNTDRPQGLIDVRRTGTRVCELYITARPASGGVEAVTAMYRQVAEELAEHQAHIVQERLFATASAQPAALAARARTIRHPIAPTLLTTRGSTPSVLGVQIHAIGGIAKPTPLAWGGTSLGCTFAHDGYRYVSATGIHAPGLATPADEARRAFEIGKSLLEQAGATWHDVARTWLWMDDILSWYGELNRARTTFFQEQGLFDRPNQMPASTGIGVSPAEGRIAMDLFAAFGQQDAVKRYHASGNQRSAKEYGSAFARSAITKTPAGQTVYCSGTAAIDTAGRTCHVGDSPAQVDMTIENVEAVLRDMGCSSDDVVQAMAYCATPQAEAHFRERYADLPWPVLIMAGDVCRDDLLFEVEVTAMKG